MADDPRLSVRLGRLTLLNPVICASGEPVMTEAGIRAALKAGAAGVIAKSVNEQPAAARQLDHADYAWLDCEHRPIDHADPRGALFCRSGLSQRDYADWFHAIAAIDRDAARSPTRACAVTSNVGATSSLRPRARPTMRGPPWLAFCRSRKTAG
jgi:hypothetical protein